MALTRSEKRYLASNYHKVSSYSTTSPNSFQHCLNQGESFDSITDTYINDEANTCVQTVIDVRQVYTQAIVHACTIIPKAFKVLKRHQEIEDLLMEKTKIMKSPWRFNSTKRKAREEFERLVEERVYLSSNNGYPSKTGISDFIKIIDDELINVHKTFNLLTDSETKLFDQNSRFCNERIIELEIESSKEKISHFHNRWLRTLKTHSQIADHRLSEINGSIVDSEVLQQQRHATYEVHDTKIEAADINQEVLEYTQKMSKRTLHKFGYDVTRNIVKENEQGIVGVVNDNLKQELETERMQMREERERLYEEHNRENVSTQPTLMQKIVNWFRRNN